MRFPNGPRFSRLSGQSDPRSERQTYISSCMVSEEKSETNNLGARLL